MLKIAGSIVAPTTLLTSLLFYFGLLYTHWFYDYFGVNSTVLGFTSTDYLTTSVDALFVPITMIAGIGLLVIWGHTLLRTLLAAFRARIVRVLTPTTAATGLALSAIGLWAILSPNQTVIEKHYVAVSPLSLAAGVLLLTYAFHLRRVTLTSKSNAPNMRPDWLAIAEWGVVFMLVGISLFWAATDYSSEVGKIRAHKYEMELSTKPSVVLYSAQSLSLHAAGVREVACENPDAAYRFRYEGLKLVRQAGDRYLFLPATWSRTDGAAIVMPRNDSLRLEFTRTSTNGTEPVTTC
jgi:hypothetical protein